MPYSLTRQEIAEAGTNQGEYLQKKQEASAAWKEIRVGAGFAFTAIGVGLLMWCYCAGWWGRIHPRLDPEAPLRAAVAAIAPAQPASIEISQMPGIAVPRSQIEENPSSAV